MQTTSSWLPSLISLRLRRPTIRCPLWQSVLVGDYAVWINFRVLINRWRAYRWRVVIDCLRYAVFTHHPKRQVPHFLRNPPLVRLTIELIFLLALTAKPEKPEQQHTQATSG